MVGPPFFLVLLALLFCQPALLLGVVYGVQMCSHDNWRDSLLLLITSCLLQKPIAVDVSFVHVTLQCDYSQGMNRELKEHLLLWMVIIPIQIPACASHALLLYQARRTRYKHWNRGALMCRASRYYRRRNQTPSFTKQRRGIKTLLSTDSYDFARSYCRQDFCFNGVFPEGFFFSWRCGFQIL